MSTVTISAGPLPSPVAATPAPPQGNATSLQFAIFMAVGFSVTLGIMVIVLGAILLVRHVCQHSRTQAARAARQMHPLPIAPLVEPKDIFVVVHPGGAADVAYRQAEAEAAAAAAAAAAKPKIELIADCTLPPDKLHFTLGSAKPQRVSAGLEGLQAGEARDMQLRPTLVSLGSLEPRQSWVIGSRPCSDEAPCSPAQPDSPC